MYRIYCIDPDGTGSHYQRPDGAASTTNDVAMARVFAMHLSDLITNVSFMVMEDIGGPVDLAIGLARKGVWVDLVNDKENN